jgi:hypothetical protein
MSDISELMAKSFSIEELANRLRDHGEPAVRILAEKVISAIDRQELRESEDGDEF